MIDINNDVFSGRLFIKSDPMMTEFSWENYYVNILATNKWWSRPYEYQWVEDACRSYFDFSQGKSAIDIATGVRHPGMFILRRVGFSKVVGTDLFDTESYENKTYLKDGMQFVKDDILSPKITDKFDCLTCISVLEHFHPDTQKKALENMISYLKPNGSIIVTFDMPGYDYPTNLPLYREILLHHSFLFREESLKEGDVVVRPSNCANAGRLSRRRLSCFRLFARR